jgi:hypothetical protein
MTDLGFRVKILLNVTNLTPTGALTPNKGQAALPLLNFSFA